MSSTSSRALAAICALWLAAPLISGCGRLFAESAPQPPVTVLEPYPRHEDADAVAFNDLPVRLYFFTQAPPRRPRS